MDAKIEVEGLTLINRALRSIDKEAPKGIRLAFNEAADLLVAEARPKIAVVTGAARRSLVARSTRSSARVAIGGKKAPYFPWWEFGGQGRISGRPTQRDFISEGRSVYPTLREIRPRIQAVLTDRLQDVIRDAGLEPS